MNRCAKGKYPTIGNSFPTEQFFRIICQIWHRCLNLDMLPAYYYIINIAELIWATLPD